MSERKKVTELDAKGARLGRERMAKRVAEDKKQQEQLQSQNQDKLRDNLDSYKGSMMHSTKMPHARGIGGHTDNDDNK